jgi:subtilisin
VKNPKLPVKKPPAHARSEVTAECDTTGRYLVTFKDGATRKGIKLLKSIGLKVANMDDVKDGVLSESAATGADVLVFPRLGMAVLSGEDGHDDLVRFLNSRTGSQIPFLSILPERTVYLADTPSDPSLNPNPSEDVATWGIQRIRAHTSQFDGTGIRIAVLDSGLDLNHADFAGRTTPQQRQSFVWADSSVQDVRGHGTHCTGIACGPRQPQHGPRYGVAGGTQLFIGKVVNDQGVGAEGWIAQGLDWAIKMNCVVISMSIEQIIFPGDVFNQTYELAARRALDSSLLVIASAGNHSDRKHQYVLPVSAPANCPSIMAVGSVGLETRISNFSNGGINPSGGEVNIAGPGERIYSSFPSNSFARDSGTSMATPFVAGVAALYAQAVPTARGRSLWNLLVQSARGGVGPSADVGSGLVQAPQ